MKDYTVEFLHAIAQRLSSRESCRKIEYLVYIGILPTDKIVQYSLSDYSDVSNRVYFYPERTVFPDTHHRQHTDLTDIVCHVMRNKFLDTVYDHTDQYGHACFKDGSLTPGVYQYVLSFDRKRRQWVNKNSLESL